ncbi:MAG: xanthine dehydrogenase [Rhodospirillales bacterium]|nr:xanthine dehydrogenase [Rhodospirillales bacterium]
MRVLVRGIGDVGSAVAHAVRTAGHVVLIHDVAAPAIHRRAMSFADAMFDGTATLEGLTCVRSDALDAGLVATVLPYADARAAFRPDVLVDARLRKRAEPEDLRADAPLAIGLGPGFDAWKNCHVAVETSWEALGRVVREGPTLPLRGEPKALGGAGRERLVYSPVAGAFRTASHIGDRVAAGETVGSVGTATVAAPIAGTIRGLVHDGIAVAAGTKLLEVDPRPDAVVAGLGERPRAIAVAVLGLLSY